MKVSYDQPKAHKTHAHYSHHESKGQERDSKEMSKTRPRDIST